MRYPIEKRNSIDALPALFGELNSIMRPLWSGSMWPQITGTEAGGLASMLAPMDRRVSEDGTHTYRIDLPGVSREDIKLESDGSGRYLIVSGERKSEHSDADYIERSWGRFERRIPLPKGWDPDAVEAKLIDGVLTISLPVKEQESQDKRSFTIE